MRLRISWAFLAGLALLAPIALAAALGSSAGINAPASLKAGFPGGSLEGKGRLAIAFPVVNEGGAAASSVQVRAIDVDGAARVTPKLPLSLGTIRAGGRATVFATFASGGFAPRKTYVVRVAGTFTSAGRRATFRVARRLRLPPASPGKSGTVAAASPARRVKGGKFPRKNPVFGSEVNETAPWATPIGRFRRPPPRPKATAPRVAQGLRTQQGARRAQAGINFLTNAKLGQPAALVNEPSGAAAGKVVFVTVNSIAAYSTNGGASFTRLDPTTIFPQTNTGFCCDQIVQYVPSIDRFIWLMQQSNGDRIAAASPAAIASSGGTAWTYWDITAAQLGASFVDYPDLSVGTNSLYVSTDAGPGLVVIRIPLSEIAASATIHFRYTHASDSTVAYFGHLAQNARDEIFWAGHNSNSNMRVFSWQESSNTYFWRDVGVGTWPNDPANMTSTSPDGQDWLTKARSVQILWIAGVTRVFSTPQGKAVNQIWFAWSTPRGNGFPQPHVQIVVLDRNANFKLVRQMQIWNPDYAFAYPALTSNGTGEVGMSLEYGGGTRYENHVVGFWGDFVLYATTATNAGVSRFGDYVTIRPDPTDKARFDAFGYGVVKNAAGTGSISDTRYVAFRRP